MIDPRHVLVIAGRVRVDAGDVFDHARDVFDHARDVLRDPRHVQDRACVRVPAPAAPIRGGRAVGSGRSGVCVLSAPRAAVATLSSSSAPHT